MKPRNDVLYFSSPLAQISPSSRNDKVESKNPLAQIVISKGFTVRIIAWEICLAHIVISIGLTGWLIAWEICSKTMLSVYFENPLAQISPAGRNDTVESKSPLAHIVISKGFTGWIIAWEICSKTMLFITAH